MDAPGRAVTWSDVPFVVASLAAGALLLYLGRSLTFWFDEWRTVTFEGGLVDYFRPVNEHWSTFPLALYRATFSIVGLHSYLPYLAQVVVLHLVAVAGAYVLIRRRLGRFSATLLALPLLLLGAGAENLFWAFQTGFVGAVAFGVWALVFVERPRKHDAVLASALLIGSVASTGVGLLFVAAVAVRAAVDVSQRARVWVVTPSALLYLAWYLRLGRDAIGSGEPLATPGEVVRFSIRGIGTALEELVGLGPLPTGGVLGFTCFALAVVLTGLGVRRGRTPSLACACVAGLVVMYILIGVVRAGADYDYAESSRYVYVASFFLILGLADLATPALAMRLRGRRAVGTLALTAFLAWIVAVNVNSLVTTRNQFRYEADLTRALIRLAVEHAGERWVDPGASHMLMPAASELPRLLERHGSPLDDALVPGVVRTPAQGIYEYAALLLAGRYFRVEPASGELTRVPVEVVDVDGGRLVRDDFGCVRLEFGPDYGLLKFRASPGARFRLTTSRALDAGVWLGYDSGAARRLDVSLGPRRAQDLVTPSEGRSRARLTVVVREGPGSIRVCDVRAGEKSRGLVRSRA